MSLHDETNGHDDHGGAGHEVDKMPSGRLFNLLFGLSALTLVACIGVVQLFYRQVDTIRDTRDTKVSFQLAEYRQQMGHVWLGFSRAQIEQWLGDAGFGGVRVRALPADPQAKGPALFVASARRAGRGNGHAASR